MNIQRTTFLLIVTVLAALRAPVPCPAAEWGSLKGRFVVEGTPPTVPPLVVMKDEFCINTAKPKNKSLVVTDGKLANAVVYVRLGAAGKIEVHPDYEAKLKEPAVLDNKMCEFQPHVTLVRVGQPFVIKNSDPDPVSHNTNAKLLKNGDFNVIIPVGDERKMEFKKAETLPMPVNCNIHPFMSAHMLVQDHPYMAVSKEDGTFEIKNIPVGKHEFQFWHEGPGYMRDLKLEGATTNRQGRASLAIVSGKVLDLGDIKVPASMLK
jgi:hypothetical protein